LTIAEAARRGVPRVRLVCAKCGRRGDYAASRLRERFGDATLIKVRETLSADCYRRRTLYTNDYCRTVFEW
jgi:hypothetical protein